MSAPKIVGLGLCVVDRIYVVDRLDPEAIRTRFHESRVGAGGMTANALAQAAALGCRAHVLSWLGADADGRFLRRELRRLGVVTRRLVLSPRAQTTTALVLVDRGSGERRFVVPDRRALERRAPDFDLAPLSRRSLLLVDGHFPAQALRAVRRARELGAVVIGDFHRPSAAVRRLLPFVDHPVVSHEYARAASGGDADRVLHELAERSGGSPVVTLGERGGIYLLDGRVRRYRAERVRVRDTTGAGDVFHGAFAAALGHGLAVPDALALAARAGARACTALGGTGRLLRDLRIPRRAAARPGRG